jgi:hypothetical protein
MLDGLAIAMPVKRPLHRSKAKRGRGRLAKRSPNDRQRDLPRRVVPETSVVLSALWFGAGAGGGAAGRVRRARPAGNGLPLASTAPGQDLLAGMNREAGKWWASTC